MCACVCKYTETSESSIALHRLTTYGALFLFVKPCNFVPLFGLIKMVPPKLAPAFELHFYPEKNLSSLHAPQRRTKIRSFLFCGCYLFVPIFESRNSINNFIKTYIGRHYSNLLHFILNYLRVPFPHFTVLCFSKNHRWNCLNHFGISRQRQAWVNTQSWERKI